MKVRVAMLGLSAVFVWGCAPPEVVPATPPGVELPRAPIAEADVANALGESAGKGEIKPRTASGPVVLEADSPPTEPGKTQTTPTGLKYETVKAGTGASAKSGQMVSVHYVGTLLNGDKFDSSRDRGTPYQFQLGTGSVIKGWDEGVAGMKVGEVRNLTIPPSIAYGNQDKGQIPPNSTLLFEVELMGIQ